MISEANMVESTQVAGCEDSSRALSVIARGLPNLWGIATTTETIIGEKEISIVGCLGTCKE